MSQNFTQKAPKLLVFILTIFATINVFADYFSFTKESTTKSFSIATMDTCNYELAACAPVFPGFVDLCIPSCFWYPGDAITEVYSTFHCSISYPSDSCFKYKALPGMMEGFVDSVTVQLTNPVTGATHYVVYNIELGCVTPPTSDGPPVWTNGISTTPITQLTSTTISGSCTTVNMAALDPDATDAFTYSIINGVDNGVATPMGGYTSLMYCPTSGYAGTDTLIVQVCDTISPIQCSNLRIVFTVVADTTPPPPVPCSDTIQSCTGVFPSSLNLCLPTCITANGDSITNVTSSFGCSIEFIPGNDTCFTYQPLPGMTLGFVDELFVTYCNASGTCATLLYQITLGCDTTPVSTEHPPMWVNPSTMASISSVSVSGSLNQCITIPIKATDVDSGDVLSYTLTQPSNGSVWYNADHTAIIFCPANNACGTISFPLTVTDQLAPVQSDILTINVSITCPPPPTTNCTDTVNMCMGVFPSSIVVCPDFCDIGVPDSISAHPTFECSINYPSQGCFEYSPLPGVNNYTDVIMIIGVDLAGTIDTSWVAMTVQNTPCPVIGDDYVNAVNDNATTTPLTPIDIAICGNDSSNTTVVNTIIPGSGPLHGYVTVNSNCTITYYPTDPTFTGVDCFQYNACSALGVCDAATVCVTVAPSSTPPSANNDFVTAACCATVTLTPLGNDFYPPTSTVTINVINTPNGTITVNTTTGVISYEPAPGFTGVDSIQYTVCDQFAQCDTAWMFVTITIPNTAPVITVEGLSIEVATVSINEDSTFTVCNVMFTDAENDTLSISISGPNNGTWSLDPSTNCWSYTPNPNFFGTDTIVVFACDPSGLCDSVALYINVIPFNDPPVANPNVANVMPGDTLVLNILGNDSDADNLPSEWNITILDSTNHGTVFVNPDGTITYIPMEGHDDIDTFVYAICDPGNLCDTAIVIIYNGDLPNNDLVAVNNSVSTLPLSPVNIPVTLNDINPKGNPLIISNYSNPNNGTLTLSGNIFTYTPNEGVEIDSFWYVVCDTMANQCDTAWVFITVNDKSSDVVIPNYYSPTNGYIIEGLDAYPDNTLMIFNRWGEKVYEQDNYSNNWGGNWSGGNKLLPDGTYYYLLYLDRNNITEDNVKAGFVVLKR